MAIKLTQIPVINSLRGLAALSVCLYHFVCTTTGYITNEGVLEVFHFGQKGVQVFFIISGIVIPLSMLKSNYSYVLFTKFISKRFVRIEPPYLVAVLLGVVYTIVRNYIPSSNSIDITPSIRDIILHLGYLIPFVEGSKWINPVFWTLSIEFQYYLFLALCFPMTLKNKKYFVYIFLSLILFLTLIPIPNSFFPFWASYFGLGIFYTLYLAKKISVIELFFFLLVSSLVIFHKQGLTDLIIGMGTLLTIHLFSKYKNSLGTFLGNISYSLYLIHSIIGSAFINFMSHRYVATHEKIIIISLGVVISICSAYIFWILIEKPSQNISQKIRVEK